MASTPSEGVPRDGLSRDRWEVLADLVDSKQCTPIIGAGASEPTIPLAGQLGAKWAEQFGYPLTNSWNLSAVAQFMANRYDQFPKDEMQREIRASGEPDFSLPDNPHGMLADLELPVYVTTNYDDFMAAAIRSRGRDPQVEYCRWHGYDAAIGRSTDTPLVETIGRPLVYHLHGHVDSPRYMVLTEEDYLRFLLRMSEPTDSRQRETSPLLSPPVLEALAGNALLFVGYSLADWNFRLLLRGLTEMIGANFGMPCISIQLAPQEVVAGRSEEAKAYIRKHLGRMLRAEVDVYWGSAAQFASDFRTQRQGADQDAP